MAQRSDSFDLAPIALASGESRRLDLTVAIDPFQFAGERYTAVASPVPATLDITRTTGGHSLRLRFDARLVGPCMRCLEDATGSFTVDAREIDQPGGGEELDSPYPERGELDLRAWARDALALELPAQILCRDDCLGICAVCGENLNRAGPAHGHERAADPRWAKLSELRIY